MEGSVESRGAENGEYARDTSSKMNMEGIGTVEVHQKGKKIYRKKEKRETVGNHLLDDGGEACSGTEEGLSFRLKEKFHTKDTNARLEHTSLKGQRKKSKKLFSGGNFFNCDISMQIVCANHLNLVTMFKKIYQMKALRWMLCKLWLICL